MLKRHARFIQLLQIAIDAVAIAGAFFGAVALRLALQPWVSIDFRFDWDENLRLFACILPLWLLLFYTHGLYATKRRATLGQLIWPVARAVGLGIVVFAFVAFLLKVQDLSRGVVLIFGFFSLFLLAAARLLSRWLVHFFRRRGYNFREILIVGSGDRAREFASIVAEHANWGVRIIGFINLDPNEAATEVEGIPVLGTIGDVRDVLDAEVIDEVCVFGLTQNSSELQDLITNCEEVGVETTILFDPLYRGASRPIIYDWYGFHLLTYTRLPLRELELFAKPVLDWIGSVVLIALFSPLLVGLAIAIRLTSEGPVIFKQTRVGRNGRNFTLYKFRSMYIDAEERLQQLLDRNEKDGPIFKMKDDPRITKIGKFLRRSSMDELPQLFNVFQRHMSLVGPRPPIPSEVEQYRRFQRRRLSMPPGMTGLWQVSGRSDLSFDESMKLDLEYIDNWSIWLDLKILFRTIAVILKGTGAY